MKNALQPRLAKLEASAGIGTNPPPIVVFFFADHVEHEGQSWQRGSEETERDFHGRVVSGLIAADYRPPFTIVCFGAKPNLPPLETRLLPMEPSI